MLIFTMSIMTKNKGKQNNMKDKNKLQLNLFHNLNEIIQENITAADILNSLFNRKKKGN
jgi:hypothetical protein